MITNIIQIMGKGEENIPLFYSVKCEGNIEGWLKGN